MALQFAVLTVIAGVIALIAISVGSIRLLPAWTASRGVAMRTAARDLARFGARTTGATAAIAITPEKHFVPLARK